MNAAGVTICLLNRYLVPGYQPPARPRSRGLLLLDLIAAGSVGELWRALEGTDLRQTAPFVLAALEPAAAPRVAAWDGATLEGGRRPAPGFLLTSSSVTEPEVAASREATFAAVVSPRRRRTWSGCTGATCRNGTAARSACIAMTPRPSASRR